LTGEKNGVFTEEGMNHVEWSDAKGDAPALTWFRTHFDAPEGRDPVAIRMTGMGKGMIWVNGQNIGRYWMSYLSPLGKSSQEEYHIPRSYLKQSGNMLVILEEEKADPKDVEILTVNRDTICSYITDYAPPHVKSWAREESHIRAVVDVLEPTARLKCPNHKKVVAVDFASYGDPVGACGSFSVGSCHSPSTKAIIEQYCLGKQSCIVPMKKEIFEKNGDACPDSRKTLAIQVKCAVSKD